MDAKNFIVGKCIIQLYNILSPFFTCLFRYFGKIYASKIAFYENMRVNFKSHKYNWYTFNNVGSF